MFLDVLQAPDAGPVVGISREIRSDEWAVATPLFQACIRVAHAPRRAASTFVSTSGVPYHRARLRYRAATAGSGTETPGTAGIAAINLFVYSLRGFRNTSSTEPHSTISPSCKIATR